MATPPLSLREAQRRIAAIDKALKAGHRPPTEPGNGPTAVSVAADALGMARVSLRGCLTRIEQVHGIAPDWSLWQAPKGAGDIATRGIVDRGAQRLKDENAALRAEIRRLQREANAGDDLRQAMFGLAQQPIEPKHWQRAERRLSGGPGVPVLFTSDFQWGECVRRAEVDGLNEYGIEVARKRYRRLIETTVSLCFDYQAKPRYPGLVYLRGGDAINGEIHEEFLSQNELLSIPSVKDLCETECAGIEALLGRFDRLLVATVPGNHGRTTRKPYSAGYADTNYETLLAWMIEREFKNEKRVRFVTPLSGDYRFQIYGTRFLLTHGDRIGSRGGQGFIGPIATILRGHYKVRQQYARMGQPVDYVLNGHYHTYAILPHGISNGSLVGFNAFAKNIIRAEPEPASQTLFFVSDKFGLTHAWPVYVDDTPASCGLPWISDRFMEATA